MGSRSMPMDRSYPLFTSRPDYSIGRVALLLLLAVAPINVQAANALLAVAANFSEAAEKLQLEFARISDHEITITSGSTGKLYAQIVNGAPFDVLLAADRERPQRLLQEGHAEPGSGFTYAVGRLTLWSPVPGKIAADGRETLRDAHFRSLAVANPALAPYGAAAKESLLSLGVWEALEGKIVMGENVGQAQALVATGNAELGLVALSGVSSVRNRQSGSRWDVPAELHAPIRQDAVLLRHGAANPAARAFISYLQSAGARAIIRSFGYGVE